MQRRYIVEGTKTNCLNPEQIVEDARQFTDDPQLGDEDSLNSIKALSHVLTEVSPKIAFDDFWFCTRTLVERNEEWAQLRSAARRVLMEVGVDLEAWVRNEVRARDG